MGILNHLKIRFLVAGIVNTILGFSIFPIFFYGLASLKIHYLWLLCLSYVICGFSAFNLSKFFVFKTQNNYLQEYIKFSIYQLAILAINAFILPILVKYLDFSPVKAQTGFAFLTIIFSYFWQSRVTFFKKNFK